MPGFVLRCATLGVHNLLYSIRTVGPVELVLGTSRIFHESRYTRTTIVGDTVNGSLQTTTASFITLHNC